MLLSKYLSTEKRQYLNNKKKQQYRWWVATKYLVCKFLETTNSRVFHTKRRCSRPPEPLCILQEKNRSDHKVIQYWFKYVLMIFLNFDSIIESISFWKAIEKRLKIKICVIFISILIHFLNQKFFEIEYEMFSCRKWKIVTKLNQCWFKYSNRNIILEN